MTKIIAGPQIKKSIAAVQPKKIAVAYLSAGWRSYLDRSHLKEIIVSPVVGTDPQEVIYLAQNVVGWENVHLLERLHSKIYLGETSAAFGSFNLSHGGLSGEGNLEAGAVTEDPLLLADLSRLFDEYKAEAGQVSEPDKLKRLGQLQIESNAWLVSGESDSERRRTDLVTRRTLDDYEPITDEDFYCCLYDSYKDYDISDSSFQENASAAEITQQQHETRIDELAEDYIAFLEEDTIEPNHWMLVWGATPTGRVDRRRPFKWMYLHVVQPHGVATPVDGFYSKVALQWRENIKQVPPQPPFELDKQVLEAIQIVVDSGEYPCFLFEDKKAWSINPTFDHFKKFIRSVKATYKELKSNGILQDSAEVTTDV